MTMMGADGVFDNRTPRDRLWAAQRRLDRALAEVAAAKEAVLRAAREIAADAERRAGGVQSQKEPML